MQTNLLWSGIEYSSLENCLVTTTDAGSEITSTIVGYQNNKHYRVLYRILTNPLWETIFFEIDSRHSNQQQTISYTGDGKGNWTGHGKEIIEFKGCIDIDIPLTPFTNTLPINRLKLAIGQEQEIKVIYLDLLEQEIRVVRQKYRRISDTEYHYQNVPNDFEAKIRVDERGFVIDYPALFERKNA